MTSNTTVGDVVAHFERKTQAILQRYGPGPRVHYHAGLVDEPPSQDASGHALRRQLVEAQERVLSLAAGLWDASSTLCVDVLDVGCGLGGGAIFWAQEFGARVTAVTCVPSHVDWVARFAARGGVASRVQALLCDASQVPGENRFDAAVAFETACYLARKQWFPRIASLLRPGGGASSSSIASLCGPNMRSRLIGTGIHALARSPNIWPQRRKQDFSQDCWRTFLTAPCTFGRRHRHSFRPRRGIMNWIPPRRSGTRRRCARMT
jgi:SAM-dependent methyltransferase